MGNRKENTSGGWAPEVYGPVDSSETREEKGIRGLGPESPRYKSLQAEGLMSPPQLRHRCRTRTSSQSSRDSNLTKGRRI